MLFVVLSLNSNSDQETLKSSLGVGFSVTPPHVTAARTHKCSLHWSLAAAEAEMYKKQTVYLP